VGEQQEQTWSLTRVRELPLVAEINWYSDPDSIPSLQAAAPLVRYMTKANRRDFIEFLLGDINDMKSRNLIRQLRNKFLSMHKKLEQLQKDMQTIKMRSREAGEDKRYRKLCASCIVTNKRRASCEVSYTHKFVMSSAAGVHDIDSASSLYYQRVMSPSSDQDRASAALEYVRLQEMAAARDSLASLDRDWTIALQQPKNVGELLLKASCNC